MNILLTSTCWRNDYNGFSHQGPGLIDTVLSNKGIRIRLAHVAPTSCLFLKSSGPLLIGLRTRRMFALHFFCLDFRCHNVKRSSIGAG